MEYLGILASAVMGIILGLMGGGGSILTVPILVYLFSLSPTIATGYSLFIVGAAALFGSIMYFRKGEVDFQVGFIFAIPSIIGVNISRGIIIPIMPNTITQLGNMVLTKEVLIMAVFASVMIAASYSMLKRKTEKKAKQTQGFQKVIMIAAQGLGVGLLAGFVGAGGGFLIIPALVFMAGLSMRIAIGTSLMIIALQSLLGFAGDISRGLIVDWNLIGKVVLFAVIGIFVGSAIAGKVNDQKLKSTFGWFVLAMGITIIFEQFRNLSL